MITLYAYLTRLNLMEKTLTIIKPDAIKACYLGKIYAEFYNHGFNVVAAKMKKLSYNEAMRFYDIHREKSFFSELVEFMCSGPIMIQVLERADAVKFAREILGNTNPALAAQGTIRAKFGTTVQNNAVHGSDSIENAYREISFFFPQIEIYSTF